MTPGKTTPVQAELHERAVVAEEMTVTGGYFGSEEAVDAISVGFNAEEIRRSPGRPTMSAGYSWRFRARRRWRTTPTTLRSAAAARSRTGSMWTTSPSPTSTTFPTQGSTGGPIGILNIDFIDQVDFLISGFSASYGDRLSSVVDIDFKNGVPDDLYGKAFLSFAGFGAMAEGPLPSESGSWMVSASKSYLDLIVGAIGTGVAPNYGDVQGKLTLKFNDRHSLRLLGIGGRSTIDFDKETSIDEGQRQYGKNENSQGTLGLRWNALWSTGHYSTTTLSYSGASYDNDFLKVSTDQPYLTSSNVDRNIVLRSVHFVQLSKPTATGDRAGRESADRRVRHLLCIRHESARAGGSGPVRRSQASRRSWGALFATIVAPSSDRWTLSAGLRADYFNLNASTTVSPRLAALVRSVE